MVDRTIEELFQAPTEGYGEAIVISEILAEIFEIKTNLLQLVQAKKFHGRENDNPHTHISNFKRLTATLKYRDVPNDDIKLMLFPYSLDDRARILACPHHGFSELTQIDTFYNGLTEQDQDSLNAALGGNLLNKTTREALQIIENKSKVRYSRSKSNVSRVNTNSRDVVSKTDDRIDKLADQISNLVKIVNKQVIAPAKAAEKTCVTCGGTHAYYECIATYSNPSSVCAATGSYNQVSLPNRASHQIPPPRFASVQNNPNSIFQNQPSTSGTLLSNTIPNPKGEMKVVTTRSGLAYDGPSIPTESPLEKVDEQNTEEILDKEHSNSSGNALLLMPKFASTIKSLLANKDKLFELAKVPLNKNCSAMLLKKLPEKLGDLGKFLIPCDFPRMEVCRALADLGASINLMPLSIWKKLSLPELTPTRMTLELADRSITRPKGVAEDIFVKVGKFHFPSDFVVVDFEDPRVPLILGRSFLRTGRALIDVYREEITLRVNDESITFNLSQTMRYSSTCDDTSVNRVDVIDVACEDFVQDVLDFQYNPKSSSPTLVSDDLIFECDSRKVLIVKSSSPTLTPFGESDFFLEEIEDFLNDDSIPTGIENSVYDPEGDILFLEKLLNEDPFSLPPMDLKVAEESKEKSSDSNKLPVIIAKNLKVDEREALINDLKSHKRAIAWKIFDIKGIDPRFCTHKILMEDDYKPAVQSQRRVNPKIHDVIKKEVIKLLNVGMIYPISDSPWVSPIHCVLKKGVDLNMESEITSPSTSMVKCCDCGCSYCHPTNGSYSGTWLRSVKRKVDEYEGDGDKFFIPGLVIPAVARVEIENECDVLREMVSNQQRTIQDLITDLEEERYASSSAANEAMSMILKLQREKAEVQMEARQFKRFSEEKMAHDQQELMALEELLYRREQSIQSLTFEVQAYKHRMVSFGLTESEADGKKSFLTHENSIATNLESQFDFMAYDYPPLKCDSLNEKTVYLENDSETVDIEKYAFGETPRSLKDIEERINQLENSPTHSQPIFEKVIVGHSPMKKHSRRFSSDSASLYFATVKEDVVSDSSRLANEFPSYKKVETVSDFGDEMSDRIYTIDPIHNTNNDPKAKIGTYDDFMSSPKESSRDDIEDPEVKKLYARIQALEADRESMRQTLISMRTDKAQLVLLKEIAQHLCKEISPPSRKPIKKPTARAGSAFLSVFMWIASLGYLKRKTQRNKHIFNALVSNAGLLMLLDKGPQMGQWRCLSCTQV
nr:myosin-binding protein 7 [Tanacetum cinerariifolium]